MIDNAPNTLDDLNDSGRFIVQMDDGRQKEFGPGDIRFIPPGHDGWVTGDEKVVALDFQPVNPNS